MNLYIDSENFTKLLETFKSSNNEHYTIKSLLDNILVIKFYKSQNTYSEILKNYSDSEFSRFLAFPDGANDMSVDGDATNLYNDVKDENFPFLEGKTEYISSVFLLNLKDEEIENKPILIGNKDKGIEILELLGKYNTPENCEEIKSINEYRCENNINWVKYKEAITNSFNNAFLPNIPITNVVITDSFFIQNSCHTSKRNKPTIQINDLTKQFLETLHDRGCKKITLITNVDTNYKDSATEIRKHLESWGEIAIVHNSRHDRFLWTNYYIINSTNSFVSSKPKDGQMRFTTMLYNKNYNRDQEFISLLDNPQNISSLPSIIHTQKNTQLNNNDQQTDRNKNIDLKSRLKIVIQNSGAKLNSNWEKSFETFINQILLQEDNIKVQYNTPSVAD